MLVLKYVVPEYPFPTLYFGIANVIANGLIMLRFEMLSASVLIKADHLLAPSCCGCRRIWKMTILIT